MNNRILCPTILAIGLISAAAWTQMNSPLRIQPASVLSVSGTSTVRSFECRAKTFDASVESAMPDAVTSVLAGEKGVATAELKVPIEQMDCGNGTMNEHMRKALKATQHPVIAFKVDSYELTKADAAMRVRLNGALTIGGTRKDVVIDADAKSAAGGALLVTGTYTLNMSAFGITPPKLMLGTLKVADKVDVKFELLLKP